MSHSGHDVPWQVTFRSPVFRILATANNRKKGDIMNEKLTELVFIVDRSGSMAGMETDTIGGVNAVLEKNRAVEGETIVSIVLFDHETQVLRDRVPIKDVPKLTDRDYQVRGCTALLDAVGGSVEFIERIQRYLPEEVRPGKTIFVITTDGMENASSRYSYEKVRRMVEQKKEKDGWEFLFLGANMDAIETAGRFGIAPDRAANYNSDSMGTALNYEVLADTVCEMRFCASPMDGSWKRRIEEDYDRRGRRKGGGR